eukprot:6186586-Pleurochrysis_carterae.AAC.2
MRGAAACLGSVSQCVDASRHRCPGSVSTPHACVSNTARHPTPPSFPTNLAHPALARQSVRGKRVGACVPGEGAVGAARGGGVGTRSAPGGAHCALAPRPRAVQVSSR